jgi:hypothetical protein
MANSFTLVFGAAILSLGVAAAGFMGSEAIVKSRQNVATVTVKGLSERDVKADLAIWPIKFVAVGNDLAEVQAEINRASNAVRSFLTARGFNDNEYRMAELEVQDLLTNAYRNGPVDNRYILNQSMMVRTADAPKVEEALRNTGDLLAAGVVFSSDYQTQPNYLFTDLNSLKPEMLREATTRAREAAAEFARDAGVEVGTISRANQGVFEILPELETENTSQLRQIDKRLRVVVTITYELESQ